MMHADRALPFGYQVRNESTAPSLPAPTPLLLAGSPVLGESSPFEVRFPFDGHIVATVPGASAAQVDGAIAAASLAASELASASAHGRSGMLRELGLEVTANADELATTVTLETGKPITEAQVEVRRAATTLQLAAEEATRIEGSIEPLDGVVGGEGRWAEVRWFPVGPVTAVTPFNSPLNLVAHKLGAAVAAGNPVLIKPAPATPLSALALGALAVRALDAAGLPPATLSVLPCADKIATQLVTDPRIRAFQFTGSTSVGWRLASEAVRTGKRLLLELGGIGATVVHADADVRHAAQRCAVGGFLLAGQVCASVQRILVHDDVAEEFLDEIVEAVSQHIVGDPFDPATTLGPMIDQSAAQRAERWVEEAVSSGASRVLGGPADGALFPATILVRTTADMRVACEEVFAPIVTVDRFSHIDHALTEVNRSGAGLQVGVFTNDVGVVRRFHNEATYGGVIVNDVNAWRVDPMPFGGWGTSGYGREGLRREIRQQMDERMLVQANPSPGIN
jgi:acyl-CoA reductase-like NAD-dependent aldehyde dehydrogenase